MRRTRERRDFRTRDARRSGVRSSLLHANHEAEAKREQPKVWERDWEAAEQLRNYDQADQEER